VAEKPKTIKVRALKNFAWYKKGDIIETVIDAQFQFLKRLGFIEEIKE